MATTCPAWPPGSPARAARSVSSLPYPIPEVIREIDAFTMGARSVNPNATVRVVWTNTWFDPAKERAAAESLVSAGVDILGDGQDSPTTGQVAAAAGLKWTGYDSDQTSFAPNAWLTATTYNWGPYYISDDQGRDERHLEDPLLLRRPSLTASS